MMNQSRLISEFTTSHSHKNTPATALSDSHPPTPTHCPFCSENLTVTTSLRKQEIHLELQLEEAKAKITSLNKQNQELRNSKVLTYDEYHNKLEESHQEEQYFNRQDLEAELFQAKVLIELLLVTRSSHPQVKLLNDESLRQKYSDLLLESLRLKEKVEARDKFIAEKGMFPVYHYDQRIQTLRKAVGFWYRKAEEECVRMKGRVRDMKVRLEEDKHAMREEISKEFIKSQGKLKHLEEVIGHSQAQTDKNLINLQKKAKQTSVLIPSLTSFSHPQAHPKKKAVAFLSKATDIKKMR